MHYRRRALIQSSSPAVDMQLDFSHGCIRRFTLRETTGTASAVVQLFDGSSSSGSLIETISLSPGQSTRDRYNYGEFEYVSGLYMNVVSGTFEYAIELNPYEQGYTPEVMPVVMVNPEVIEVNLPTLSPINP
jgi:hypothetical protein